MFETTNVINKDTFLEIKRYIISPKDKRTYALFIIAGFCLALIAVVCVLLIVSEDPNYNGYYAAALGMLVAAFGIGLAVVIGMTIRYFRLANMIIKANLNRFKEDGYTEILQTSSFTDDKIKIHNLTNGATVEIGYNVVCRFAETKNFYTLFTKAGQFILVNKISLIETDKNEEFVQFVKEKCFNRKE